MQNLRNNTGIIGNFERIIGSFWGNKRNRIIGDVSSIIYQGLNIAPTSRTAERNKHLAATAVQDHMNKLVRGTTKTVCSLL